jgi:hypothetical protein
MNLSEGSDLCSVCKTGSLKPTGEVLVEGQSVGEFKDIGSRRVYKCDNESCGQRQIRIGVHEYISVGDDVKTKPEQR